MTEKTMITQEQADALTVYKSRGHDLATFVANVRGFNGEFVYLKTFTIDEFARLLYEPGSYEIEPEPLKVGDWVVWDYRGDKRILEFRHYSIDSRDERARFFDFRGNEYSTRYIQRLATPEEIKTEQERRLWKKLDREPNQFKIGDSIIYLAGHIKRLVDSRDVEVAEVTHGAGGLYGIYPAESFISFEKVEQEVKPNE